MIKLNERELPAVKFRAVLPEWLGPGDCECFIEFEARAASASNPKYVSEIEKVAFNAQVAERKIGRIDDDGEWVSENRDAVTELARGKFAALYDACVISWKTNIQDDGHDLKTTKEAFLSLVSVKNAAIASALVAFEEKCVKAGEDADAIVKDNAKN